ncbi:MULTISPECIES: hypothetical protein [unclassified Streptomyces]|uniref:hypothetical protein n=1 Tax=unclassified Streptomyces TaxID=2593676 RepID=UPI0001C19413|nr:MULTISPECIES: hypothetical protein [unclassified Streptomyces]AEN10789.1 conserved hypothetical protein [Streptomyces sp. SirexAA-E]MYR69191.1 hypothetical protein [Streptomyces sp. SID4939]MYR99927.1 hypothetical protein [Streptomyces sp. SID4940]MYT63944.1 hypothetical protein [Streptomyces sp. SID8357]MYT86194.1 hypothetical protein [Streptomyces sp. SID8360]
MPIPDQEPLPDVAVGHHPDYGIVAANPKNLPASTWMLERLDFHPVPGEPTLYALADQQRDGAGRTARTVTLLRNAGFRVDADAVFNPSLAPGTAPGQDRPALGEPAVAFAEHPRLGIVAALDSRASGLTGLALIEHGWRHDPHLDIYALPATTGRDEALGKVAGATMALHRSGVQVAVQPHLAQDVVARRRAAPVPAAPRERGQVAARTSPISAAALAASPARAGLPGKAPVPAPVAPAAVRPVDPRIAFSRDR